MKSVTAPGDVDPAEGADDAGLRLSRGGRVAGEDRRLGGVVDTRPETFGMVGS